MHTCTHAQKQDLVGVEHIDAIHQAYVVLGAAAEGNDFGSHRHKGAATSLGGDIAAYVLHLCVQCVCVCVCVRARVCECMYRRKWYDVTSLP